MHKNNAFLYNTIQLTEIIACRWKKYR